MSERSGTHGLIVTDLVGYGYGACRRIGDELELFCDELLLPEGFTPEEPYPQLDLFTGLIIPAEFRTVNKTIMWRYRVRVRIKGWKKFAHE